MMNKVARSNKNRIHDSEYYFFRDFGVARVWAHDFPMSNSKKLLYPWLKNETPVKAYGYKNRWN